MPKRKSLPTGADEYATTEEFDSAKYVHEEEGASIDFANTSADLFNRLVTYMRSRGIKAVSVPGGAWAGFELYSMESFEVPGLKVPQDFRYWRALKTYKEDDRLRVKAAIQKAAEINTSDADNKAKAKWLSFVESWTSYMANENMPLAQIARGMVTLEPYRTRTFRATSGHHIVVPKLEWFPEAVQSVSCYDLLSIMPRAEADMFMLNMGRVICGYNEQPTAEGLLQHDYRYFVGLVGGANLGKSRLVEKYLTPALIQCGLKVAAWDLREGNAFGWAELATADWYNLSDCLTSSTIDVISNPYQKILASGERLKTQQKGENAITIEVPTAGGFLFCANALDIPKLNMLNDDGVSDRFKCLAVKEREELKADYGVYDGIDPKALNGMTGIMWNKLAAEHDTTTEVLSMWLIYNSAVQFLTACGYGFDESDSLVRVEPSRLKMRVAELTDDLRMSASIQAKEDLVSAVKHGLAYIVSTYRKEQFETLCVKVKTLEFSHNLLLTVVRLALHVKPESCPGWMYDFFPHHLSVETIKPFFLAKERDFQNIRFTCDPKQAFELVTRYMKTRRYQFGYPTHPVVYAGLWHSAMIEVPILAAKYKEDDNGLPLDIEAHFMGYREVISNLNLC